jgi:hypothetical protein
MLSIHNVKRIRARATETHPNDSNWVELHVEGGWVQGDPEHLVLNLYFNSAALAHAFYEAFPDKLTEAERHADRFHGKNPTYDHINPDIPF